MTSKQTVCAAALRDLAELERTVTLQAPVAVVIGATLAQARAATVVPPPPAGATAGLRCRRAPDKGATGNAASAARFPGNVRLPTRLPASTRWVWSLEQNERAIVAAARGWLRPGRQSGIGRNAVTASPARLATAICSLSSTRHHPAIILPSSFSMCGLEAEVP